MKKLILTTALVGFTTVGNAYEVTWDKMPELRAKLEIAEYQLNICNAHLNRGKVVPECRTAPYMVQTVEDLVPKLSDYMGGLSTKDLEKLGVLLRRYESAKEKLETIQAKMR